MYCFKIREIHPIGFATDLPNTLQGFGLIQAQVFVYLSSKSVMGSVLQLVKTMEDHIGHADDSGIS